MVLIYFCLALTISSLHGEKHTLLHVHAIFRHGDRAPIDLLSSDLNKIKFWPNGLGELTDVGIKQHFHLGKWLRKRYNNFLNKKYNHSEIYVRSTDIDRTLMSAESNLAGLYYNKDNIIIPSIRWRPIPIHTIPQKSDIIMLQDDCEKYKIKKNEMYNSERFLPFLKKYQMTLDLIRNYTKQSHLNFSDLWDIYDILFCEKMHNITWDKWVTNEIYYNLTKLNVLDWQIMYYGEELQKLSGGLFLHEIIKQLKNTTLTSSNKQNEKLRIYSGHDTDVAALMSAIGVYEEIQPSYASCFIIELWKKPTSDNSLKSVYIKMYFRNNTAQGIILPELILKQCTKHPCSLLEFINIVRPRTMTLKEYNKECFTTRYKSIIMDVSIISGFIILLIIMYLIYLKTRVDYKVFV